MNARNQRDPGLTLHPLFERAAGFVLRRPLALALVIVPLALALGSLAGYAVARAGTVQTPYKTMRQQTVIDDLARVEGDYLLAAGDSHIERWPARRLCGLPVVNAGVSGTTAASYGEFLAQIPLPRPPRAVILTIGTNDANTRRFRDPAEAGQRFQAGLRRLLAMLSRTTDLVVVTGIPPLDTGRTEGFSAQAASLIDAAGEAVCGNSPACAIARPFPPGLAMADGVHFDDYAAAYHGLGEAVCARLRGEHGIATPRD